MSKNSGCQLNFAQLRTTHTSNPDQIIFKLHSKASVYDAQIPTCVRSTPHTICQKDTNWKIRTREVCKISSALPFHKMATHSKHLTQIIPSPALDIVVALECFFYFFFAGKLRLQRKVVLIYTKRPFFFVYLVERKKLRYILQGRWMFCLLLLPFSISTQTNGVEWVSFIVFYRLQKGFL